MLHSLSGLIYYIQFHCSYPYTSTINQPVFYIIFISKVIILKNLVVKERIKQTRSQKPNTQRFIGKHQDQHEDPSDSCSDTPCKHQRAARDRNKRRELERLREVKMLVTLTYIGKKYYQLQILIPTCNCQASQSVTVINSNNVLSNIQEI